MIKLLSLSLLVAFSVACSKETNPVVSPPNTKDSIDIIDTSVIDSSKIDTSQTIDSVHVDSVKISPLFSDETIKFADSLLALMTLAEKIGQMTQGERKNIKFDDLELLGIGSILSGGGSTPRTNTPEGWCDMYDEYQTKALESRLGIPMIYGIDAVHGNNSVDGAVIFPHNIGLGAANSTDLVERAAFVTSKEISAIGVDWNFSPCVAVPQDIRWGRTYEGYSEDPSIVAPLGAAAVRGYQSDLGVSKNIAACAKHFIGDGGAAFGTGSSGYLIDQGNLITDIATLKQIHLPGYIKAIEEGVLTVMASYSSFNGVKCHGSKYLLTDLLKKELGFEGFVVSDWEAIHALDGTFKDQVKVSINAGIDMMMEPNDFRKFITTLTELVNEDSVPMERIDDAVRRILRVKHKIGLFANPMADRSLIASFGSDEHREVARECVRNSLVLLKNDSSALPLKETATIAVIGIPAEISSYQCGGWTKNWQGSYIDIIGATSLVDALNKRYTNVIYSATGDDLDSSFFDIAIVAIAESPYAEGKGDEESLDFDFNKNINEFVDKTNLKNIPVVTIMYSGRPMVITNVIAKSDAVIAAWLPGSEGDGIVDVLSGDYNFTGKLSFSWPKSSEQLPMNMFSTGYDPLYAIGYGLSY